MPIRISFELSDADLAHFAQLAESTRTAAGALPEADVVAAAQALIASVPATSLPEFVAERFTRLKMMVDMVTDTEWQLAGADRARVLNALAYFAKSDDLIPDSIPGLGFLDDAIMVELVGRELKHEFTAYQDFCNFRRTEEGRRRAKGEDTHVSREAWLADRRAALHSRMRSRRERDRGSRGWHTGLSGIRF
jgi:uncharacterized membrane protein YkvA (DUF1232 family)